MKPYVLDACVIAKWFFNEVHSEKARFFLDMKHPLHAPDYFEIEMDSIILKRLKSGELDEEKAGLIRSTIVHIPIRRHAFQQLREAAYRIAREKGLTIYDSLYLALAVKLRCAAVTADLDFHNKASDGDFRDHIAWIEDIEWV